MINISCCLRLKVNTFQNTPSNVVSTYILGSLDVQIPNISCHKYFLCYNVISLTFSHTEGRKPECKFIVKNNSRSVQAKRESIL